MATVLNDPLAVLQDLAEALKAGRVVPYLGPGISALTGASAPLSPEALAAFFATKAALPRRAVGNAWAAAQHIESYKHRQTVTAWMADAFAVPVAPSPFHVWLAQLPLPLVIDSWYAAELRQALGGRTDWAEVQGITRAGIGEDRWFRFYNAQGRVSDADAASAANTLLYAPHGSVQPDHNFLISDADYVEVLTEIDIQTPIPEEVRRRRAGRGFLFLGCHFHDQLLRSYARQIMKRAGERHYAVVDPATLTRNELRFLDEQGIEPIALPLDQALGLLMA